MKFGQQQKHVKLPSPAMTFLIVNLVHLDMFLKTNYAIYAQLMIQTVNNV
jgi:hypothetical protein